MSKEEIDQMIHDAKVHAKQDEEKKKLIELKNQADTLIHSTEKLMREASNLPKKEKEAIDSEIANLKDTIKKDDAQIIQASINKLQTASASISKFMSKNGANNQQKTSKEEKVVDEEPLKK